MKFHDPTGQTYGLPTYPRRLAPEGLATRRQLRVLGLRPAGQPVAAQILWHGRRTPGTRTRPVRVAHLYLIALAAPVRPMTPARWRAHHAMMRARRTCPACRVDRGYVIPTSLGTCPVCADSAALAA
ncbi:RRQRL motif-containing zinc-binding protein [Streptomyces sp. NPDC127166]|uniref:RRQRL motif-containing zinc-binding protein n=1 Tax=Streptomyces sp. NPDC127166 TaxID=3345380 RepID=UPI00364360F4